MSLKRILAAIAAVLCFASVAWAGGPGPVPSWSVPLIPTKAEKVLFYGGIIHPGDHRLFVEVMNSAQPDIVVLDSPGGLVEEALPIAEEIRRRGLNTFIYGNRSCASACALLFLAGQTKYAIRGAEIGLHSARYANGELSLEGTGMMADFLAQIPNMPASVIPALWSTPPDDMFWLTDAQKDAIGVVTLDPGQRPGS